MPSACCDSGTSWSGAEYLSEPYNYAFASGSGWAAASGDLAIAVWDVATGAVLWTQEWFKSTRQYLFVTAMGPDTLVIFDPGLLNVTAVSGKTGATAWTLNPTLSGSLLGATASADGAYETIHCHSWEPVRSYAVSAALVSLVLT